MGRRYWITIAIVYAVGWLAGAATVLVWQSTLNLATWPEGCVTDDHKHGATR